MNPNTTNIKQQHSGTSSIFVLWLSQESFFSNLCAFIAEGNEPPPNSLQQQQPATCFHRSSSIWVTLFSKFHHPSSISHHHIFLIHSSRTFFSYPRYSTQELSTYQHIYIYFHRHWLDNIGRQTEPGERLHTASDRMPKMLTSLITSDTVARGSTEVRKPHFLWLLSSEMQFLSFLDTH